MYISRETRTQVHERLREVIARAELTVLEGTYTFDEFPMPDSGRLSSDALAYVRDDHSWSRLVPSADPARELFKVFRFHFAPGLDNSGFLGWLASDLKEKTGTGIFVVCGQNLDRGGIFDYWGCPAALGDEVLAVVHDLVGKGPSGERRAVQAIPSLDGLRMRAVVTADQGSIDTRTLFEFSQDGHMVSARYAGGSIRLGYLIGTRRENTLTFRYAQVHESAQTEAGHSIGEIRVTSKARIRVLERFTWDSRSGSGTNVLEESLE